MIIIIITTTTIKNNNNNKNTINKQRYNVMLIITLSMTLFTYFMTVIKENYWLINLIKSWLIDLKFISIWPTNTYGVNTNRLPKFYLMYVLERLAIIFYLEEV